MTAEGDVHGEVTEICKGEIADKCGLDMTSFEPLPKGGGGECNKVIGNAKDDTDNSYVFVNGSDVAADDTCERDLTADHVQKLNVSELIVEETEAGGGVMEVENGESVGSCVKDDHIVEGTDVSPSNSDEVVSEEIRSGECNGDEVGRTEALEEQNQTLVSECEAQQVHQNNELNSPAAEVEDERICDGMISEDSEREAPQYDDGKVKDEDENNANSTEIVGSRASEMIITNLVESEVNNEDQLEGEDEFHSESAISIRENQETEIQEKEGAESANEIPSDVNGEGAESANEIPSDVNGEGAESADEILSDVNGGESIHHCIADNSALEVEVEKGPINGNHASGIPAKNVKEILIGCITINCEEKQFSSRDVSAEPEVSNGVVVHAFSKPISADDLVIETNGNGSLEKHSILPSCPVAEVKSKSVEGSDTCGRSTDVPDHDATHCESKVQVGSAIINFKSVRSSVLDSVDIENRDDSTAGGANCKPTSEEIENVEVLQTNATTTSSEVDSNEDTLGHQSVSIEEVKKPFCFLIRIPRYDDESLKERIRHAEQQVEEKTQIRDAIQLKIQSSRATRKEYGENIEAAKSEERNAKELWKSKHQEKASTQSVVNTAKNAISIEDIDGSIRYMEHTMQHDTLPLKEEKLFIREIKKLKQQREQLSSSMGRQEAVQQALDQRDQNEKHLKSLMKEVHLLEESILKAEAVTDAAKDKWSKESEKLKELKAKRDAADYTRQEAYSHFWSLKQDLFQKNKSFYKYRDEKEIANKYALAGNREALQRICINQVETFMDLWNKNDEFRKDYVRCNRRSTLRRLGTLDGRSLGPDEEPLILPYVSNVRADKSTYTPANNVSTLEQEKLNESVEAQEADDKSKAKVVEQKYPTNKTEKHARPVVSATVSGRDCEEEAEKEEQKLTKEEEEIVRKAEERRKQEEEAKLREQRRLEEKAKANEALERKKRLLEKAQAKAELKAKKEAEQKEKEREKRARKKERKKAASEVAKIGGDEGDSAPGSEIPTETVESEIGEKPGLTTKRPQKAVQFKKQMRVTSLPPPLRNRGKKRMQRWFIYGLSFILVTLFLAASGGFYTLEFPSIGF